MPEQKQTELGVKSKVNVAQSIGIAVAALAIIGGVTGAAFALFSKPQPPAVDSGTPCTGPGSFTLSTPVNAAINQDDAVLLRWNASSSATSYDIYLDKTNGSTKVANVTTTSYNSTQLSIGTKYYWKVIAKNSCSTRSSAVWNLSTAGLAYFQAQEYTPPTDPAACGGQRGCDADNTTVTCGEANAVWNICTGITDKCPDNLAERCIQQSLCQCGGQPAGEPACETWFNALSDPCL